MQSAPQVIIGLTGAFGSGCSTAGSHLRDTRKFTLVRLSDVLRTAWKDTHKRQPSRSELQRLGDELRRDNHGGTLVQKAIEGLKKSNKNAIPQFVVVDGIRNVGEIAHLRDLYGYRFTLIAVLASFDARWDRISSAYTDKGLSQSDFIADDQRDKNEETEYGQQVELCVDRADILIATILFQFRRLNIRENYWNLLT